MSGFLSTRNRKSGPMLNRKTAAIMNPSKMRYGIIQTKLMRVKKDIRNYMKKITRIVFYLSCHVYH